MNKLHFHKFEPVAVNGGRRGGTKVTLVLHRCEKCPKLHQQELEGWWSFDQVTGKTPYLGTEVSND